MKDLVSSLKTKNPDLKEAEIKGILYIIHSKDHLTNSKLIQMTGLPKPVLTGFKSSISGFLKKSKGDEIVLNEKGQGIFSELELRPYKWSLIRPNLEEFEQRINQLRNKYDLEPKREYDQFFATAGSTIGKARILIDKGLVEDKNIALIGDDDLTSLALGIMSPIFKKITVFDIDNRILEIIKRAAKDLNVENITTNQHDIRKPLPNTEIGKYDAVLVDPPYTKGGAQLFLHRSIELLKNSKAYDGGYILFNFGVGLKNPELESKIQEIINNFGLIVEDKINKYTRYHGAETVGSASSLYILKNTPFTSVEKSVLPREIYTYEKTVPEKFPYTDHYTFKINKVPKQILTSKSKLQKVFGEFCKAHGLKVVNTIVDKFKGGGYSLTYILAASNLLIHTWPEKGAVHIDLLTCSPIYDKEGLGRTLSKLLRTKHIEIRWIE